MLLALCLCAAAPFAFASSDFLEDMLTESGGAGSGMVARAERSPYRGAGIRYDLLPVYLYENEHLYLDAYRAGLKVDFGPGKRVNAFLSHRFESYPVDQVPSSLAGMSPRIPQTDFGLSYEQRSDWGNVFGEALRDVSGISGGAELRLGYSLQRRRGSLRLSPYLMLAARDARLNDYYYGVLPSEAGRLQSGRRRQRHRRPQRALRLRPALAFSRRRLGHVLVRGRPLEPDRGQPDAARRLRRIRVRVRSDPA